MPLPQDTLILIVEDSLTQAVQLQFLLEKNGFKVTCAHNGRQGLQNARKEKPAVIISDIVMPEMDGYELCSNIKADDTLKDVPVILLTSLSNPEEVINALACSADSFVTKPYEEKFLLSRIRHILVNQEMRRKSTSENGICIFFAGKSHYITSDLTQIVDLLVSTYENAVERNEELMRMQLELKKANENLQALYQQNELLLYHAGEGIIGLDAKGIISYANPAAEKILASMEKELVGCHIKRFMCHEDTPASTWEESPVYNVLTNCGQHRDENAIFKRFNNEKFPVEYTCATVHGGSSACSGGVMLFQDISKRKAMEQKLRELAHHDPLTGLANRRVYQEFVDMELDRSQRHNLQMAILFMDLDNFKHINDSKGHDVGDLLLKSVAERVKKCVRKEDLVARLGGDEFAIVLVGIENPENAALVAQKILEKLAVPHQLAGHEIITTFSIGIALFPMSGNTVEDICKAADIAMYYAKEDGKNNYKFFEPEMQRLALERMGLEKDLRISLQNEELTVHYQPQIEISSGKIVRLQALVRWHHPTQGPISPGLFIPIAEKCGIIGPLGEWTLRTACHTNALWHKKFGSSFKMIIAVKVSMKQLRNKNLWETIDTILATTGLAPDQLEIELTESAVMNDPETTINLLNKIHQLGVRIAIDDFGTGYSSLNYLQRLPIDTLEIDLSFVANIGHSVHDETIIKAIISLAHNMDLLVTAKGVETEEQYLFLKEHQCDLMQGHYFMKPLPADEVEKMLIKHTEQNTMR
jgi:diguanylate cyclase (GGDEF)-like protein/PAS domain S-box-containing protein